MVEAVLSTFTDLPDLDASFIDIEKRFSRAKNADDMRLINNELEGLVRQMEAQT